MTYPGPTTFPGPDLYTATPYPGLDWPSIIGPKGKQGPKYTYLACDLITGRVRERVDLVHVGADRTLDQNNPGAFTASMPLGGLNPIIARSRIDATEEGRSTIVVARDGVALGEWIVWERPDRPNNGQPIPLSGSYITSYLDEVTPNFTGLAGDLPAAGWTGVEQLTIANALVAQVADPITMTTAPAGSRGVALTIPAVTASGVVRDRFDWPGQSKTVLAMLNELAYVPGGFDWDIDVQLVGNQVVRTLVLSYPRRGIDSGVVLQPAEGKPGGNVTHVTIGGNGRRIATQVIGLGGGFGVGQTVTRSNNTALVAAYPLMQQTYSDSSLLDPAAMLAKTDALAANARTSQVPPKVTVLAGRDPVLGSYRCGDYMTLSMGQSTNYPDGYKVKLRVLGIGIRPPAAGPETVDLAVGLVQES